MNRSFCLYDYLELKEILMIFYTNHIIIEYVFWPIFSIVIKHKKTSQFSENISIKTNWVLNYLHFFPHRIYITSKRWSVIFIIAILLLNHISITFQSTLIYFGLVHFDLLWSIQSQSTLVMIWELLHCRLCHILRVILVDGFGTNTFKSHLLFHFSLNKKTNLQIFSTTNIYVRASQIFSTTNIYVRARTLLTT